jgi:hypothetical protein
MSKIIEWIPGKRVNGPGIFRGIPLPDYHTDIAVGHSVSHSSLERIWSHSLALYWDRCYANPDAEPDSPTKPMILGRAAHHLFLGESDFGKQFVRRPDELGGFPWNGNRTIHREWLAEQEGKGLTVLTPDQIEAIVGMGGALAKHPMVTAGLLSGDIECSGFIQDDDTGLWLKVRPDAIPGDNDFVDLKVMSDISEEGIFRAIGDRGYHRQGALVCEVIARIRGEPLRFRPPGEGEGFSFSLVCVEATRPHCIEVVTLKVDDLERGAKENRLALRLLKKALDKNEWPGPTGYQRDARYAGVVDWKRKNDDYRFSMLTRQLLVS